MKIKKESLNNSPVDILAMKIADAAGGEPEIRANKMTGGWSFTVVSETPLSPAGISLLMDRLSKANIPYEKNHFQLGNGGQSYLYRESENGNFITIFVSEENIKSATTEAFEEFGEYDQDFDDDSEDAVMTEPEYTPPVADTAKSDEFCSSCGNKLQMRNGQKVCVNCEKEIKEPVESIKLESGAIDESEFDTDFVAEYGDVSDRDPDEVFTDLSYEDKLKCFNQDETDFKDALDSCTSQAEKEELLQDWWDEYSDFEKEDILSQLEESVKLSESASVEGGTYSLYFGHWRHGNGKSFRDSRRLIEFLEDNYVEGGTSVTYSKDVTDDFKKYMKYEPINNPLHDYQFKNGYSPIKVNKEESAKYLSVKDNFEESVTSQIDALAMRYSGKDGYSAAKDILFNIAGNGGNSIIDKIARGLNLESIKEDVETPEDNSKVFGKFRVEVKKSDWNPNKLSAYFYDMSQDKKKFPEGQYTGASYWLDNLVNGSDFSPSLNKMPGLKLNAEIPSWTLSHDECVQVYNWLKTFSTIKECIPAKTDFKDIKMEDNDEVLDYDDKASDIWNGIFDVASPQEVADSFGKKVKANGKIYSPTNNESLEEGTISRITDKVKKALYDESDIYVRKLKNFAEKTLDKLNLSELKNNIEYTGYGFTVEGDKEIRNYRVFVKLTNEQAKSLYDNPIRNDIMVNNSNRKAEYEMADGEFQVELLMNTIYFDLHVEIDKNKGKRMRDKSDRQFKKLYLNKNESLKENKVMCYNASEHTEGTEGTIDRFYGYVNVEHPELGNFYVSVGTDGDVRTDGKPWKFLQSKKYKLTDAQKQFVNNHKEELFNNSYTFEINESLKEDSFEDDDEVETAEQSISSAKTSINSSKLPAIFKLVNFKPGTINLDFGGGKFDNAAEFLKDKDVTNLVYDPYNRTAEHNKAVMDEIRKNGGADTVTCSNVLNVIKEEGARRAVIRNCYKYLKTGGTAYFTVYEGKGTGEEGETSSGYQLNRKTADYLEEISKEFSDVTRKGKLIIARK